MQMGFIGSGNMARALARGWGEPVLCTDSDSGSGRAEALVAELGGEVLASNAELAERCEALLLCHKPAGLAQVAQEVGGRARVIVSVLGGVSLAQLREAYPDAQLVRTMPNIAAEVRQGVTCLCAQDGIDPAVLEWARERFGAVGSVFELPERLMSVATATSGVAPAYVSLVAEAQVDAAVKHGLTPSLAGQIVTHSLLGSAALLQARDFDTLAIRREVTSPGGSTARGLAALERGGLRSAFVDAMESVLEVRA